MLSNVWDARPFEFKEVDIMKPEAKGWLDLYDFDVPVVSYQLKLICAFETIEAEFKIRSISVKPSSQRKIRSSHQKPSS